jgi:hypothetical protein
LRRYLAIHAPVGRIAGGRVAELEALTGVETRRIHVDKGFRGHNHARKFLVWISGQVRRVTAPIRGKYGRGPPFERTKPAASKDAEVLHCRGQDHQTRFVSGLHTAEFRGAGDPPPDALDHVPRRPRA